MERMIEDARAFYEHGWMLGTSGNLSSRVSPERFVITGSGRDKGRLGPQDFLICGLDGKTAEAEADAESASTPRIKPSAETLIHCAIYKRFERAGAVYHAHIPEAALCSARDVKRGHTELSGLEMIKGFDIWDAAAVIRVPILPNHAHIPTLATAVREHLEGDRGRWPVPCINILRHGVYAWGKNCAEAQRHLETAAYLFGYSWEWGKRAEPSAG